MVISLFESYRANAVFHQTAFWRTKCVAGRFVHLGGSPATNFIVPQGCRTVLAKIWGSGGAGSGGTTGSTYGGNGGAGGFSQAQFTVVPGETLRILTGQGGVADYAGGTAGASARILRGIVSTQANILIQAGAGGGAGLSVEGTMGGDGGNGGGDVATAGETVINGTITVGGGGGGTVFAGGAAGTNSASPGSIGNPGVALAGGNGGTTGGRGGGGGYFGGGGGAGVTNTSTMAVSGGGGGAGRITGTGFGLTGSGMVPPNMLDIDYQPGVGVGGQGGSPASVGRTPGQNGGPGLTVFYYF